MTTRADAQKWFLQWSSATYGFSGTDGLPWGKDTYMAKRQGKNPPEDPWDEGACSERQIRALARRKKRWLVRRSPLTSPRVGVGFDA